MIRKLLFAAGLATLSAQALAFDTQGDTVKGAYLGAGLGRGAFKMDIGNLGNLFDDSKLSYKLIGGYSLNPNFALELNYTDLRTSTLNGGRASLSAHPVFYDLSALFAWPVSSRWSLFGRLGDAKWHLKLTAQDATQTLSGSTGGNDFLWGVGVLTTTGHALVRIEYERIGKASTSFGSFDDTHLKFELLSLAVAWKF